MGLSLVLVLIPVFVVVSTAKRAALETHDIRNVSSKL